MARRAPPVIHSDRRVGSAAAHDADLHFFRENPNTDEYTRDLIPGEIPEAMPPGTRVVVRRFRIGNIERRARAFLTPEPGVN
jgi:hypothetical protein